SGVASGVGTMAGGMVDAAKSVGSDAWSMGPGAALNAAATAGQGVIGGAGGGGKGRAKDRGAPSSPATPGEGVGGVEAGVAAAGGLAGAGVDAASSVVQGAGEAGWGMLKGVGAGIETAGEGAMNLATDIGLTGMVKGVGGGVMEAGKGVLDAGIGTAKNV